MQIRSPVFWALFFVSVFASCVVVRTDTSAHREQRSAIPPTPMVEAHDDSENISRLQPLLTPGIERGFTHCCGDFDHVMQVDCSDRLLRCYENQGGRWRQTYGRVCAKYLEPSCYERGCIYVCD